ncbi:hypothetical protein F5ESL0260_03785 [Lactobacillus sp. ESL0260]|uniref:hypothetical protein n=1 Tax=Lactobacillus sp. ESL0260 TaxID=2069347 RepID=UPI000EFBE312|nr:hypothetical protein [Lactobacillus sp. ESL0260]RMC57943.1 hypothetical protein F5ESL0260_03785 [Lactobacillus sp. ESL0260]
MPTEEKLEKVKSEIETKIMVELAKRGWKQEQLCELMNIPKGSRSKVIYAIHGDMAHLSIKLLKNIFEILGIK